MPATACVHLLSSSSSHLRVCVCSNFYYLRLQAFGDHNNLTGYSVTPGGLLTKSNEVAGVRCWQNEGVGVRCWQNEGVGVRCWQNEVVGVEVRGQSVHAADRPDFGVDTLAEAHIYS